MDAVATVFQACVLAAQANHRRLQGAINHCLGRIHNEAMDVSMVGKGLFLLCFDDVFKVFRCYKHCPLVQTVHRQPVAKRLGQELRHPGLNGGQVRKGAAREMIDRALPPSKIEMYEDDATVVRTRLYTSKIFFSKHDIIHFINAGGGRGREGPRGVFVDPEDADL